MPPCGHSFQETLLISISPPILLPLLHLDHLEGGEGHSLRCPAEDPTEVGQMCGQLAIIPAPEGALTELKSGQSSSGPGYKANNLRHAAPVQLAEPSLPAGSGPDNWLPCRGQCIVAVDP